MTVSAAPFLFNEIEDSTSENGKACKICTTQQRNTLCQNSENTVWTRDILPHWRQDSDSTWLEICSVGARWDLHKARRKQDAHKVLRMSSNDVRDKGAQQVAASRKDNVNLAT